MFTYILKQTEFSILPYAAIEFVKKNLEALLFITLLFVWYFGPQMIRGVDGTAGMVDQSIWLLVLLALITFLLLATLVWWLLQRSWAKLKLPSLGAMVSQFNTLLLWQQLAFYFAYFVSLLVVASICLLAIC